MTPSQFNILFCRYPWVMDLLKERFIDQFSSSQQTFINELFGKQTKSKNQIIRIAVQKLLPILIPKAQKETQHKHSLLTFIDCLVGSDPSICRIFLTEIKNKKIDPNILKQFVSALIVCINIFCRTWCTFP